MKMLSRDVDVLIAGAGPTGLTLACDLARRGLRVRIFEKSAAPFTGSRGKGLQPRTLEVFDDLGVLDAVFAAGGEYPRMRVHLGAFAFPWTFQKRTKATADVPYPNVWMLPQVRTEAILRARFEELGGRVEMNTELVHFAQDDEGVTATIACGDIGEVVSARYLVGADGGHSFVREALAIPFSGGRVDLPRAIVGDVHIDGLDRDSWHVWPRAMSGTIALCPLPQSDVFQLFAQVGPECNETPTIASVNALLGRSIDRVVRKATWLSLFRPNVRLVDRYRVARVFLAGDAAHVHPPAGGQGLNTGVQDAYNLGWKLGAVLRGAPAALLDTYEEERRAVAAEILGLSTELYRKRWRRRGDDTKQLGTTYRGRSLACDLRSSTRGPCAGDRAPDARGIDAHGRSRRVFDALRGPHATLLAFGTASERVAREVRADRHVHVVRVSPSAGDVDPSTFIDASGELRRTYGVDHDALVLVRPDGYVGFAAPASSASELADYLAGISAAV